MNALRTLLLALACTFCLSAAAQWQWLDKDGRKVFSDRGPPPDVPSNRILKRPDGKPAAGAAVQAASGAASAAKPAARASGPILKTTDPKLEAKKKEAQEAEEAKVKAAAAENLKKREDSCLQARKGLELLNSGIRLRVTNAKGEPEVMDDSMRAVEAARIQKIADTDCK